jgi:hypothetical protein
MKNGIHIIFLLAALSLSGQNVVVDARFLPYPADIHGVPNVEGKVLVSRDLLDSPVFLPAGNPVTVYPGFPVTRPGKNERGGCYGNLDNDPELEIIYTIGAAVHAFNADGTPVAGWPRNLDFPTDGAAAFGDIDGDGYGEIVVTTHQTSTFAVGSIFAFEINGTDVQGFPLITQGGALRTPVLADIDGDGALEIVVAIRDYPEGFIYIFRGDGSLYPEWPKRLDYVPGSAVAVGDITGDDSPEIVAESYYGVHAFTAEGILMPGFPYYPGTNRVFSYSTPVLADIDGDGLREIICGDHSLDQGDGAVHIIRSDGTSFPGWPQLTGSWVYGPPSVGDIDGDGLLDVAVGDQAISPTPQNEVYAWTAVTAQPLAGFPITGIFAVNGQIILADLDGDNEIELMFDDNTSEGKYPGYNHDGTPMDGWPLETEGSTFFITPYAADLNRDGILDICGAGYEPAANNANVYLWNANVPVNDELAILPILQYNTRHNGVFGDYLMVGTEEQRDHPGSPSFSIYPNPATHRIYLSYDHDLNTRSNLSSWISDLSGRVIYGPGLLKGQNPVIDLEFLPPGAYLLNIARENGTIIHSGKIILLPH